MLFFEKFNDYIYEHHFNEKSRTEILMSLADMWASAYKAGYQVYIDPADKKWAGFFRENNRYESNKKDNRTFYENLLKVKTNTVLEKITIIALGNGKNTSFKILKNQ